MYVGYDRFRAALNFSNLFNVEYFETAFCRDALFPDKGVEVILQTPVGTQLQVTNRSTGNNFIVDVSGGQLRLPSGEAFTFRSQKPLARVTEITVTNVDANTVRVTVVGEKTLPAVELT